MRKLKKRLPQPKFEFGKIRTWNDAFARTLEKLKKGKLPSPNPKKIFIVGETGTGKKFLAEAIHEHIDKERPYVPVFLNALPEKVIEGDLFGVEEGAYTGVSQRDGFFKKADGGTIFLDEISKLDPTSQQKLLQVIEEKRFYKMGGTKLIEIKVDIIVASNEKLEDIEEMGKNSKLLEDLRYRLGKPFVLPPLRERREDIPFLVSEFLDDKHGISKEAMKALCLYSWPGNIRELAGTIEDLDFDTDSGIITYKSLPKKIKKEGEIYYLVKYPDWMSKNKLQKNVIRRNADDGREPDSLEPYSFVFPREKPYKKKETLLSLLEKNDWNRKKTMKDAGCGKDTLKKYMDNFGLRKPKKKTAIGTL